MVGPTFYQLNDNRIGSVAGDISSLSLSIGLRPNQNVPDVIDFGSVSRCDDSVAIILPEIEGTYVLKMGFK